MNTVFDHSMQDLHTSSFTCYTGCLRRSPCKCNCRYRVRTLARCPYCRPRCTRRACIRSTRSQSDFRHIGRTCRRSRRIDTDICLRRCTANSTTLDIQYGSGVTSPLQQRSNGVQHLKCVCVLIYAYEFYFTLFDRSKYTYIIPLRSRLQQTNPCLVTTITRVTNGIHLKPIIRQCIGNFQTPETINWIKNIKI